MKKKKRYHDDKVVVELVMISSLISQVTTFEIFLYSRGQYKLLFIPSPNTLILTLRRYLISDFIIIDITLYKTGDSSYLLHNIFLVFILFYSFLSSFIHLFILFRKYLLLLIFSIIIEKK